MKYKISFENSWDKVLKNVLESDYFLELMKSVECEYADWTVYPKKEDIFNALKLTDFESVRVVILGQDPYHGEGQAHGLAFSVPEGIQIPPSLANIFKERDRDLLDSSKERIMDTLLSCKDCGKDGCNRSGNLTAWAKQGVLLLNTVLTVRSGCARSHARLGWQKFTDEIIKSLNSSESSIVFMLWGNDAIEKRRLIDSKHLILTSPHPSPLSAHRGYFNSSHFSKANRHLQENNLPPIDWLKDD